jgi:hypothetical protein
MASNVSSFSASLGRFARATIPEQLHRFHRALVLEALKRIILASPVDTGRFRANWQVSHGTPATGEVAVGEDRELTAATAAQIALDQGIVEVQAIRPGEVTFIVNNVPYAVPLAEGHSPQAPPGWLDAIVEGLLAWAEAQGARGA